ncbi:MAG: M20/M25/M40 family metallo-hydrolase [Bacteroides sp.]|nr:MAG: M20/M25/M40 family metallo-hydrolase [Bacteroides sp.]
MNNNLYENVLNLLKNLIKTPSVSKFEDKTADIIQSFLDEHNIISKRYMNNIWAFNKNYDDNKKTILLISHHDTVPPSSNYSINPFFPLEKDGKIFGLGSNDAGGCLVSLLYVFIYFYNHDNLNYNLLFVAASEEEISGNNGIKTIYSKFFNKNNINLAIVGEPTNMEMNIGEKGLLVLDIYFKGKSSHVALPYEGENAIYKSLKAIQWIKKYKFRKKSEFLGDTTMNVTQIEGGIKHNIIPDICKIVVDIRVNEHYNNLDLVQIIKKNINFGEVVPRSTNLNSKLIDLNNEFVKIGLNMNLKTCFSATVSDRLLIPVNSIKMGPGKSERSHVSDEYVYVHEIQKAILIYSDILKKILLI